MKKIIIAPDSFKECLSAKEVAFGIEAGIRKVLPDVQTVLLPIADGGEGTLDAITKEEERIWADVSGPDGNRIHACFGLRGKTAVIEMAAAAGLMLVSSERRHAALATTYGVGELILQAMEHGAEEILLTVGGSATNDGGCGMAAALGVVFKKADGSRFVPTGATLSDIAEIDAKNSVLTQTHCKFTIATDVKNPLLGPQGATRVYARQKGAEDSELDQMELGMKHYADLLYALRKTRIDEIPGSGAGGGVSVPLLAFSDARLVSGIEAVLKTIDFEKLIRGADVIITGEGKTDRQSLYGKAVGGVVRASGKIPVVAMVGCLGDTEENLMSLGLDRIYTIRSHAKSDRDSIENAAHYLSEIGEQFALEWNRE